MRTLSAPLLAAQKSASGEPFVQVQVTERIANVRRLRWERLYTGSEPDGHHAAAMPADGSLIRARSSGGQLYYQRVPGPGSGSDYSTWTALGAVSASTGIALCSQGATVMLFYVDTDNQTIKVRESADNGATLGTPQTVTTAAGGVGWLAAAQKSDGTTLLAYSVGATVYRVKRVGGSWGSAAAWTNSVASVSGLTCLYLGDFNLAVAGSESGGARKLWTVLYGDGFGQTADAWSSLLELTAASNGSNVEFRAPSLGRPDVYRLFFVEKYSGTQAYARPFWTYSPATANFGDNVWREPVPFDLSSEYGLAQAASATYAWLSMPSGVWRASLSAPPLDLTPDVLELDMESGAEEGHLRVVLRNDDGRYNDLPSGPYAAIRAGSQVNVSPGYRTTSGTVVSAGPRFWIEGWHYQTGAGRSLLTVQARDAWSLLEAWRARRQYAWSAGEKSVLQILSFLFGRAGLEFASLSNSSAIASLKPAFTVQPGDDGLTAVRRLLAMVPDVVRVSGEYGYVINPTATQSVDYAYGADHAILSGRYETLASALNRVQVFGAGLMVEDFDWSSVGDLYDRLRQVHDTNLATVGAAQDRADAVQREQEMAAQGGAMAVPANCGQELYDVISVTDAAAGLSAATRRVLGLRLEYQRARPSPAYRTRLGLGAP